MKTTFVIYLFVFAVFGVVESSWFVQEVVEYNEGGDLFSQEDLLPLRRQPPSTHTGHQQDGHHTAQKSPQKASAGVVSMTSERQHGDAKDAVVSELEDQHLIPVKTGSKQKTKPVQAGSKTPASATSPKNSAKDASKTASATTVKTNATAAKKDEPTRDSAIERKGGERKLLSKEEEVHPAVHNDEMVEIRPEPKICAEPEKDVDCLFEEEELIPVIKKPKKPKKSPPKPSPPKTTQTEQKNSTSQQKGTAESETHVSQRKLLQVAESSSNERRMSNNSKIDIESRPGDNGNDVIPPATQEKSMQVPVGEEEEEMEEEDADLEDVIWRVKRQAVGDPADQEFSGDTTTTASTTSTTPTTTPDPIFTARTTGDITYETLAFEMEVDDSTCPNSPATVQDVRNALEKYFSGVRTAVAGLTINMSFDITMQPNGNKQVVTWKMKLTNLGATPENNIDRIMSHIQSLPEPTFQVGSCTTTHANGKTDFVNSVNTTLSNPCTSPNPCPLGYDSCQPQVRGVGRCTSKCLTAGVNAKCQNGAPCVTQPTGQPTCQCMTGYTGQFCETMADDGSRPTAATPVVGNVTATGFNIMLPKESVGNLTNEEIAQQVRQDLMKQFQERNITEFDIEIANVTVTPNGSVIVSWNFKLGNANGIRQERAQEIINSLATVNNSNVFTIFNNSYLVPQIDLSNLYTNLTERLRNPCLDTVCDFGYNCTLPFDYGDPVCIHKCLSHSYANKCQYGSCELSPTTGEPYCLCTNQYTGEFCDQPNTSDQQTALTTPQIVGTTAGALIVAAAVASCCLYFLLCRKKSQQDISFSYLEDQDQDIEGFSDASSKLYNCYLDRPQVTVEPLDIYGMNQEFNS